MSLFILLNELCYTGKKMLAGKVARLFKSPDQSIKLFQCSLKWPFIPVWLQTKKLMYSYNTRKSSAYLSLDTLSHESNKGFKFTLMLWQQEGNWSFLSWWCAAPCHIDVGMFLKCLFVSLRLNRVLFNAKWVPTVLMDMRGFYIVLHYGGMLTAGGKTWWH